MNLNYQGPGKYQYYKGDEYEVIGLALSEFARIKLVIYRPSDGRVISSDDSVAIFRARPLDDFNQMILPEIDLSLFMFRPPDATPPVVLDYSKPIPLFRKIS